MSKLNIESGPPSGSQMSRSMQIQCRFFPFFFGQACRRLSKTATFFESMQHFSAGKMGIISSRTKLNMIFSNVYMLDSELWGRCFPCPTLLRFVMDVCKVLKNKLLLHVCPVSSLQEDWLAFQAAQHGHCVAGTGIMRSFYMPASDSPRGCSIQRDGYIMLH